MNVETKRVLSLAMIAVTSCFLGSSVNAGLVGHWTFEEGSGDTTADKSPSGTTGMITNAATGGPGGGSVWVTDPVRGSVLGFSGADDGGFVRAGNIPRMTLENDFTWAFWAKQPVSNAQPNNIIMGNRFDENNVDFEPRQFIKFTPTKFEWHMNGNGNDNMEYDDLSTIADKWQHHAVVKSGANLTYYRGGEQANTQMITQALDVPQPLFFGGQTVDGENWEGFLDDARIYDHALSAEEVAALVPEPSSLVLVLIGLLGLLQRRRTH